MKSAVWLPLFNDWSDPSAVVELATVAEASGWDGLFVWDHLSWRPPETPVGDPWVTLAAVAAATSRLRLGPMVTPIPRRRPAELARQTVALDRLSKGRLTLGVGLGSDVFAKELTHFGEDTSVRGRSEKTDETLDILRQAWNGDLIQHDGPHFQLRDVTFNPLPTQTTIPVWVGGSATSAQARARAARHEGFVPFNLDGPDEFASAVDQLRPNVPSSFEFVATARLGDSADLYSKAGATWTIYEVPTEMNRDDALNTITKGKAH